MDLPKGLAKVVQKLFDSPEKQNEFVAAVTDPKEFPACIAWTKNKPGNFQFEIEAPASIQPSFVDRLKPRQQPGKHTLHDQGFYYCLDFSSVFEAAPLTQLPKNPNVILDLCSAPGGKSILAWNILEPKWLLSNEVVVPRARILISNLKRCRVAPSKVLSQRPEQLVPKLESACDVVIVDAPCSGQSLLVKKKFNPGAFNSHTVNGNSKRQKKIISDAAKCVAPGGFLNYMTCTFAKDENEDIIEWFLKKNPNFKAVEVPLLKDYRSHLSEEFCYRMWPQENVGAGGFTTLLQKDESESLNHISVERIPCLWTNDAQV